MHIMGGQRRGWPDYCGLDLSSQSGTLNEPCTTQDMDIAAIKKHNKLPMIIKDLICGRWDNFLQSTGKKYKGFPSSAKKISSFPWLLKVFLMWLSVATGETWHPIAFPIGENNVGSASQKWFGQIGCFLLTQPRPDHASPCPLLGALSKSSHITYGSNWCCLHIVLLYLQRRKEGEGSERMYDQSWSSLPERMSISCTLHPLLTS